MRIRRPLSRFVMRFVAVSTLVGLTAAVGLLALNISRPGLIRRAIQNPSKLSDCPTETADGLAAGEFSASELAAGEPASRPASEGATDAASPPPVAPDRLVKLSPIKVVVKPWVGRHHVYGVFSLPIDQARWSVVDGQLVANNGQSPPIITINLPGRQTYCAAVVQIEPHWVGLPDQPDRRVVIGLMHTRTAWWLMAHGQKGDLENPNNWSIVLPAAQNSTQNSIQNPAPAQDPTPNVKNATPENT